MKHVYVALTLLCFLPLACKQDKTTDSSDTSVSVPATPSTDTVTDTADTVTDTATEVFTERTSFEVLTAARSVAPDLRVEFHGVVAHVLAGGVTRAIIPRVPGHSMKIIFPGKMKTEIQSAFGVTCSSTCEVPFNEFALQIVDSSGATGAAFNPSPNFKSIVTHLKAVPSAEKPFDTKADLVDDIFKDPQKGSVVAGFFELAGGDGDAAAWSCGAHFVGETPFYDFPSGVNVDFKLSTGSKLQVMKAVASGTPTWTDVATLTGPLTFIVDNDLPSSTGSHFNAFALLSKKKVAATGKPVDLPDVMTDGTTCIPGAGDVPGCSNSQWP